MCLIQLLWPHRTIMSTLTPALEVWIALSFSWELDLAPSEVICQGNSQFVSERENFLPP